MATFDDRHPPLPPAAAAPVAREVEKILSVQGEERIGRLLRSDHLASLVALMPPEELFFTLKEAEEGDVTEVLSCATREQVQFLFDLELWRKDQFRRDRVRPWLQRLVDCEPGPLDRWLQDLPPVSLTLLLGSMAKVMPREEDNDPFQEEGKRAPFTLDGVYYVFAAEEDEPLVRELFGRIREQSAGAYHSLVEALGGPVDSEAEELAYEERSRRLAERGFPKWEEAYEVYARIAATSLEELPVRPEAGPAAAESHGAAVAPRYPIATAGSPPDTLAKALRKLDASGRADVFHTELAYLTNKVLVADGLDMDEIESFHRALRKVAAYASLGTEVLCGPDDAMAVRALSDHWLQHLFRVGWTRVRSLQSEARRFLDKGWPAGHMERLLFLDSPLPEIIDGLLRRHPLWYAGDEEPPPLREFRTLHEVRLAQKALRMANLLGRYLLSVISFQLKDLREASSQLAGENLKGSTVFLTALVNSALGRDFRFAPIDRKAARRGLAQVWEVDRPPRRVRPGLADSAVEWCRALVPATAEEELLLRDFVSDAFRLLEEEFGHLATDETPDPRFTKGLWIE